ncbi:MAG: glycosyltransferase family 39 protein [Anaerolineales bacterium]|nr:glycosyltransferase family 39 protein [Anaerolineales bacterium]
MLMLIGLTAVFLRFYQLGTLPPGLYRDEAFNGLDAVRVLHGEHPLFFPANNGREPTYIYLVAAAIGLLGQTAVAVRLPAAVIGSLTTWVVYKLADSWFGRGVGLLTAWLWATTFWPVHLGRIGLRVGLLVPLLATTFWLATLAYRRQQRWLWLAAGAVYGLSFYTYLAARFTPVLLLAALLYLLWYGGWRRLWPGMWWFVGATAVILLPLLLLAWQNPVLVLGRTGQVSVLNPTINGGDLLGTLWHKGWQALGMFVWRGDPIVRHNGLQHYPGGNGRSVFDFFMAVPFLLGVVVCLRRWQHPPFALTLLWTLVMLGSTILAEDTPHFLRAVGVLPAALILPALGLQTIWRGVWGVGSRVFTPHTPHPTPHTLNRAIVAILLAGSFGLTLRDYVNYGRQSTVAYLFEDGARRLAEEVVALPPQTAVYLDRQFYNGWPSIPFLLADRPVNWFGVEDVPQQMGAETAVYAWPYGSLNYVAGLAQPPAQVTTTVGPLVRGDLEETAYPLYFGYTVAAVDHLPQPMAVFTNGVALTAAVATVQDGQVVVDLTWRAETAVSPTLAAFVHVAASDGLIGQADALPGGTAWRADWWQPGLLVVERRVIGLERPFDPNQHHIFVGLYDSQTGERLPLVGTDTDSWEIDVFRQD